MRDVVTKERRLSLAGRKPRISPDVPGNNSVKDMMKYVSSFYMFKNECILLYMDRFDYHLLVKSFYWWMHDDVMTWKRIAYYWPFVKGIHGRPMDSRHKRPVIACFGVLFGIILNKLQIICRICRFETPWHWKRMDFNNLHVYWVRGCSEAYAYRILFLEFHKFSLRPVFYTKFFKCLRKLYLFSRNFTITGSDAGMLPTW